MVLFGLIATIAVWCSREYWLRLADDNKDFWRARYLLWFLQGLLFPWIVWSATIIGLGESFPSLVPQIIDAQQARVSWSWLWFKWSLLGGFVIMFHWAALTYLWLLVRIFEKAI